MINFDPFPAIKTENLLLRRMIYNDIHDLFEMRTIPEMIKHVDLKLDQTIDETKAYINKMNDGVDNNKWIIWAIELKSSKR